MHTYDEYKRIREQLQDNGLTDLRALFLKGNKVETPSDLIERLAINIYMNSAKEPAQNIPTRIKEYLEEIDWEKMILDIHSKHAEWQKQERILRETWNNTSFPCRRCNKATAQKDLQKLDYGDVSTSHTGDYCEACAQYLKGKFSRTCAYCDAKYRARQIDESFDLCYGCRSPKNIQDAKRVNHNLQRAINANLAATLTLKQWLFTLNHFNNQCAYCLKKYTCMEHYIPITQGGGTTQSNCFPTCGTCNHVKNDRLPEQFERRFPSANIQRIKEYIAKCG